MASGVPAAVWAPLMLWAIAAFTVVGYIGTVGWVHSSGRGVKQVKAGREEAIRLDLESQLVSLPLLGHPPTHA